MTNCPYLYAYLEDGNSYQARFKREIDYIHENTFQKEVN